MRLFQHQKVTKNFYNTFTKEKALEMAKISQSRIDSGEEKIRWNSYSYKGPFLY